jgi:hypothetical protein
MSDAPRRHDGERPALGADLVLPGMAVAFAIYYFASVWDLTWEAKANAVVVGTTLLVLCGLFVARVAISVLLGRATLGLWPLLEPAAVLPKRLAVVGLAALFVFLLPWLGLTLGLFLLTGALMVAMGVRAPRRVLAVSGIVALSAYLLFIALLNSRLPRGPVEKLLAALF